MLKVKNITVILVMVPLWILLSLLSACNAGIPAGKEEEVVKTIAQYFEEADNRIFEVAYPVRIDNEECYKVTVSGILGNGEKYPIDVFAVNPDYSKRFFYRNDTEQYEPFYSTPQFACQTSPNREWRMESVGMYLDGPSGLHSLEEMRIIDLSTGSIEWSGESYLSNRFMWSEDSRFVAAQYSGRQWTATQVIDTNDFSIITMSEIDDIIKIFHSLRARLPHAISDVLSRLSRCNAQNIILKSHH